MGDMTERPAHWKQPGELYDCKGFPIYPGDLLRTCHFKGCRGRKHYLYHVAVFVSHDKSGNHGYMKMIPASDLEPSRSNKGGSVLMSQEHVNFCEIVQGVPVGTALCFHDRKKITIRTGTLVLKGTPIPITPVDDLKNDGE